VLIKWKHIKRYHDVQGHEIFNALRYGVALKPDREVEGRYVIWSRLTEDKRLIRVVFKIWKINGEYVVVVTAFGEE